MTKIGTEIDKPLFMGLLQGALQALALSGGEQRMEEVVKESVQAKGYEPSDDLTFQLVYEVTQRLRAVQ